MHLLDVPAWRNWADKTALTQNTDRSMHSARTDGKALGGRSFDALSPLLHEYTYQAMVHDLISLDNGTCMFSLAVWPCLCLCCLLVVDLVKPCRPAAPLQAAALSASRCGARLSFLPRLVAARLAHVSHTHVGVTQALTSLTRRDKQASMHTTTRAARAWTHRRASTRQRRPVQRARRWRLMKTTACGCSVGVSLALSLSRSVCLSVSLCLCLSNCKSIYESTYLHLYLSFYICLYISIFYIYVGICIYIST